MHGPPASGKLTIANEIRELIGARVFHNHLTLDVAKSLLTFGDPELWILVHDLRLVSLTSFFKHGENPAVTTWCYEEPEDHELFQKIKSIAVSNNGRVLPAFLNCDIDCLESRVENRHRREMEKLCDAEKLRKIMSEKNYCAVPDELCIEIDSSNVAAKANAERVVREFNLKI